MSRKEEVNAHSHPREGQPLLYRHRQQQVTPRQPQAAAQVTWTTITPIPGDRPTLLPRTIPSRSPTRSCTRRGNQGGGRSVPRSSVTGPRRLSVSDLPPLHGPQLTLAPPQQLSAQSSRASTDCVKLPPLPAAAAASGSSPRGTARAVGPMSWGQRKHVPPPPWGTLAAGRAQGTPSLGSRTGGLWNGSAARQGHRLPPVTPARGAPLRTRMQSAWKPVWRSVCENPQPCATSVKELEEKREEEEHPETQAAGERDRDLQSASLAPLEENEEKREELEKVEEDRMYAELFGQIFFSMGNEESAMTFSCDLRDPSSATPEAAADPSVPLSACSMAEEARGEAQNYLELVSRELLADLGSDSEDSSSLETLLNELLEKWEQEEAAGERAREAESPLSIPPRDEELEPAATPPDSDLSDQGHSEPLPEEAKGFAVCAAPADAADEADAAGTEAGRAQAAPAQEKPCGDEPPAGACPAPAQPLARSVPACPAGSAAVPQPPAPRRWRSMAKRARRALRRLFSCSCLRGQPEE
ncbi:uncharacterized protein LOC128792140 [Vidua chalybeata]|uniref:uncharacterized protein LOC128792140 n=1 Tax=Vidua chalybeata TaxID=81927 RepID=UPI0023A8768B|nr:uncharacterized protein LOC128792140 [Vidua chalybeata]